VGAPGAALRAQIRSCSSAQRLRVNLVDCSSQYGCRVRAERFGCSLCTCMRLCQFHVFRHPAQTCTHACTPLCQHRPRPLPASFSVFGLRGLSATALPSPTRPRDRQHSAFGFPMSRGLQSTCTTDCACLSTTTCVAYALFARSAFGTCPQPLSALDNANTLC
jgi:hypothetical protein